MNRKIVYRAFPLKLKRLKLKLNNQQYIYNRVVFNKTIYFSRWLFSTLKTTKST